jgi:hypothetical protein
MINVGKPKPPAPLPQASWGRGEPELETGGLRRSRALGADQLANENFLCGR